jgi:2-methylisocitrate lyase-like PEP mutase family enzyme
LLKKPMDDSAYFRFCHQHQGPAPLLLATIWDARSAAVSEAQGFAAVGTSSAALAAMLGYPDGEQLPFAELRYLVGRICASTTLPVSVDLEGGYGLTPAAIAGRIAELAALGVAGINLEDSTATPDGGRRLRPAPEFAATLRAVRAILAEQRVPVFLNVRTDTYLLPGPEPLTDTHHRAQLYAAAGADGLFVPGLTSLPAIGELCRATPLPVNVMALPDLPAFGPLAAAGVRRISMGNFLFEALSARQQQLSQHMLQEQSFSSLFN